MICRASSPIRLEAVWMGQRIDSQIQQDHDGDDICRITMDVINKLIYIHFPMQTWVGQLISKSIG